MYNDGRYPIIEAVNTTFLFKLSISKDQQETRLVSFFFDSNGFVLYSNENKSAHKWFKSIQSDFFLIEYLFELHYIANYEKNLNY